MRSRTIKRRVLALAIIVLFACHIEPRQAVGPNYQVRQVIVVPDTATIDPLGEVYFQAYGRTVSGDSVGVAVQWSASVGSIASGVYTADTADGDAIVMAQYTAADAVPLTSTATVHKKRIVALLLSPSAVQLQPGGIQQFSSRAVQAGGDTINISPQYTATGGTITSAGLYRAGSAVGSFRVIASRPSGVFDTASVTIGQPRVASVSVSPDSADVPVGGVSQLTATTRDPLGNILTGRVVTWSSDAPAVASVSATGLVSGVAAGAATITATSEGQSAPAAISVVMVPVASVVVSPPTATLRVGTSALFIATTEDGSGNVLSGRTITWSSSAPSVASVSSDGLVSALASGSATITATSEGQSGTASVTVSVVPVATVSVTPPSSSLRVGGSVQLSATMKDSAGAVLPGRVVTWASSAPAVATVSTSGMVSAVGAGSATITATSEGKSGTSAIAVTVVPVASVTVSPASSSLVAGQTAQLSVTTKDSAGNVLTGRTITWASSSTTVATVSASGLVTAKAAGSATVTATSEGKSGTASVTVTVVPVATVTVSPASASVAAGQTVQLTATEKDAGGNVLTGRVVTWATSNAAVATVSTGGLVSGLVVGTATITATSEGKSGSSAITVTVAAAGCAAACRYVAVTGNDGNAGTKTAPWRTIQHAADVMNPGDTVIVNDGVYTGGANVVTITRSGTAAAWMVFRAANRWGAIIDGQNNSSTTGFEINGNYIRVEGFEVRNTNRYAMETYGGREDIAGNHDVMLVQNHLHDVGHICTGSTGGIVGVSAYSDNLTIDRNVIHDIGRLGPGEQGCVEPNANWQNHDHGVYNGVGNNVVIRNNLFYNFTHGWAIQRYNGAGSVTTGLTIVNNTFGFPNPWRDAQIIIATATNNIVIANNIFYQPTTAGVWFDGAGNGATLVGNISTDAVQTLGSGLTMSGNMPNTDPLFVNATGFNFHLTASSPARGLGSTAWCPSVDFDGTARSGACSAGAYQN